jgi:hypothetical protein
VADDHFLLRRKVAEDTASGHTDGGRDLIDRRRLEALCHEQLHRGFRDLLAHRTPGHLPQAGPVAFRGRHASKDSTTVRYVSDRSL